jgi:hypothetical protein
MSNTLDFKKYNSRIGFEYEFYTTMNPKAVKRSLAKVTSRKVFINDDISSKEYVTELNKGSLVITIDRSGGIDMYEVVTPPLPYLEGKEFVLNMAKWLDDFGKTTKHSGVHLNLNIDRKLKYNLDIFKFILSFDENFIYELYPNRKGNIYCQSIKQFYPINIHMDFKPEYKFNYEFPKTKYFGVNFSKLEKNYLEYRYIGGENYHKHPDKILAVMDYCILHLYSVIDEPHLKVTDKIEFQRILEPIKNIRHKLDSYEVFTQYFPKVNLSVDMNTNENIIKTHWLRLKEAIFSAFIKNKFVGSIDINWNTDLGMIEFANNDKLRGIHFNNIGFYNCTITGVVENCTLVSCDLNRLSAYNSKLRNCEITDGKVFNSIASDCDFNNVYVSNPTDHTYISGRFNEGVITASNFIKGELDINEKNRENGLIKIIDFKEISPLQKIYF